MSLFDGPRPAFTKGGTHPFTRKIRAHPMSQSERSGIVAFAGNMICTMEGITRDN